MIAVVAHMTRTHWVHMELKGWNACHCRLPSSSVIGLTPGGGWAVSPCSSGAKRAGSHRQLKNVTIPPTMASGDGTAV